MEPNYSVKNVAAPSLIIFVGAEYTVRGMTRQMVIPSDGHSMCRKAQCRKAYGYYKPADSIYKRSETPARRQREASVKPA